MIRVVVVVVDVVVVKLEVRQSEVAAGRKVMLGGIGPRG